MMSHIQSQVSHMQSQVSHMVPISLQSVPQSQIPHQESHYSYFSLLVPHPLFKGVVRPQIQCHASHNFEFQLASFP